MKELGVYSPWNKYHAQLDKRRCKAAVYKGRMGSRQCMRNPWRDGWCKQHHPDTVKEREAEKDRRYREQRANSLPVRYDRLREQYNGLIGLLSNALDGNDEAMEAVKRIVEEGMIR